MRKPLAPLPQRQLVAFRLGDTEFALDVSAVLEVLRQQPITALPRAPEFVEGVVDVRGTLVPVVDLRRRFLAAADDGPETRLLVVDLHGERLGVVVDQVTEVLRVPEGALGQPPAYLQGQTAECVESIVRLPGRLVVLLDVARLLSTDERIALADVAAAMERLRADVDEKPAADVPDGGTDDGHADGEESGA